MRHIVGRLGGYRALLTDVVAGLAQTLAGTE
jgi:hypothetical protein